MPKGVSNKRYMAEFIFITDPRSAQPESDQLYDF